MDEQYQLVPRRLATQDLRDSTSHYAAGFVDPAAALRACDAPEQANSEVVLIRSDSLDTVPRTHATQGRCG